MELSRILTIPRSPDLSHSRDCQMWGSGAGMDGMRKDPSPISTQTIRQSRRLRRITCSIEGSSISHFVVTLEVQSMADRRSASCRHLSFRAGNPFRVSPWLYHSYSNSSPAARTREAAGVRNAYAAQASRFGDGLQIGSAYDYAVRKGVRSNTR
jgi:hypothetical protein